MPSYFDFDHDGNGAMISIPPRSQLRPPREIRTPEGPILRPFGFTVQSVSVLSLWDGELQVTLTVSMVPDPDYPSAGSGADILYVNQRVRVATGDPETDAAEAIAETIRWFVAHELAEKVRRSDGAQFIRAHGNYGPNSEMGVGVWTHVGAAASESRLPVGAQLSLDLLP